MKRIIAFLLLLCTAVFYHLSAQNSSMYFFGRFSSFSRDIVPPNPSANISAYQISGTAITAEAWIWPIRLDAQTPAQPIINRLRLGASDSLDAYSLKITYANGFPQAAFSVSDGTAWAEVVDPDTLMLFEWTHLAGTYDGAFVRIYANGALKAQTPSSLSITATGRGLYVGGIPVITGLLDDVRLWNVTRTGVEINSTMNTALTGSEPGLAGYWKMDTVVVQPISGASVVADETANGNDLQASGGSVVPYNSGTPIGLASASLAPPSIDLGTTLYAGDRIDANVSITNSSSSPLFGYFATTSPSLRVFVSYPYFAAPMSVFNGIVSLQIIADGSQTGTLTFNGNISSTVDIPFSYQAYPLPTIAANNVFMWLSNTGGFARDGITGGAGFEWPKGSGIKAIFASGIWVAANVGGGIRTAVASYSSEFKAGPIVGGAPADPTDRRYRVYNIKAGDNAGNNQDYAEWPVDLGAPVRADSTPALFGDQTLFSVYNDMDPTGHHYQTQPLGAEVQQTTFAFDQPGALQNTVFLRFKIINKSMNTWQNAYVGLWSDPDMGNFANDLVGIDTSRALGYTYNGTPTDPDVGTILGYGATPPAVGYDILKGAFFSKPIQSFVRWAAGFPESDPPQNSLGAPRVYNTLQGLLSNGDPFVDPITSMPTRFPYSGDPVTGTGWVDSVLGDRRFVFSTGPFDLEPGQSKEMIAAIIVAQGTDYLNSITELRNASDQIQALYNGGQIFGGAINSIVSTTVAENDSTTLDDLGNSGAQFDIKGGTGGATVEAASYVEAPPGASSITTPAVAGVGKYIEVQVQGNVQWPVEIRIYYTANDLAQAGVTEGDLNGIYYWNGTSSQWILYSNSGADDQGRGPSTTGVNTTNVSIGGVSYEGYVYASAYHLTPIIIGANVHVTPPIGAMYTEAIDYLASLPVTAFKAPGRIRRGVLIAGLQLSERFYERGKARIAAAFLHHGIFKVVTGHNSWIMDPAARDEFVVMIQNLIQALGQPGNAAAVQKELTMFDEANLVPLELTLSEAYPNPFNPQTTLQFTVPEDGKVAVRVFNMLGEEVKVLFNGEAQAGQRHTVEFSGSSLASGMYIVRLESAGNQISRKILLMK